MKKVKDTIDAYERAIAGGPRAAGSPGEALPVALLQRSGVAAFCEESVRELERVARERARPSPQAPGDADWRAARGVLTQIQGVAAASQVPSVRGMLRDAPTEMGPMLEKLRGLYND